MAAVLVGGAVLGLRELRKPEKPEIFAPEIPSTIPEVARAPSVPEPEPIADGDGHPVCACAAITDGMISIEQQRTLELACRLYSDEQCRYPFKLFASPKQGNRTAVIVKRSTGDCGGCGALTIAAVFDHHKLEAIGELGRYGRFGNGPDAARYVSVAGEPVLELTSSTSMGGYSEEVREYFLREGDGFRNGLCVQTAYDERGAREQPTEWNTRLRHRADGALEIRYVSVKRGSAKPTLTPVTIGFDRQTRQWRYDRSDEQCVSPPLPDLIDI